MPPAARELAMWDLFSTEARRNPYPLYDQLRAAAPLFHEPQSGLWFVFDYDGARRVLADHEGFSSRCGPEWLLFLDPPRHARLRALISQAFTPRAIAGLEPRIRDLSRTLLNRSIERGQMDLAEDYSIQLPLLVITQMLGLPADDQPRLVRWSDAILNMSYTIPGGSAAAAGAVADFEAATAEVDEYLTALLTERRARPQDDLLTRLVQAEVDGQRLTKDEIRGFVQLLLVAGQETTTNLINNAVLCLLENPREFARLRERMELLHSAIEEVLRYRSPFQWMFRVTTRDVEIHGQTVPAGKMIIAVIGSANRDPRQFPEANRFDIAREPNPHIAFGHGIHFCLGAPLARLEARIALTDLVERLPGLALASDEPWEPRKALHVHGPTRLPIRFQPGR
jgi:cytochrome P450